VALALHDNIMRVIVRPDIFLALAAETAPPPRAPVPSHLAPTPPRGLALPLRGRSFRPLFYFTCGRKAVETISIGLLSESNFTKVEKACSSLERLQS
jgi:hypothetical protein